MVFLFQADDNTKVEIVKYSDGSGVMGKFATIAVDGTHPVLRIFKWIFTLIRHPLTTLKLFFDFEFGSRSIILLVMQNLDNAMQINLKRGVFGNRLSLKNEKDKKVPAYIGIGQEVMRRYAEKVGGTPLNAVTEIGLNMATTAHIMGGCQMGKNAEEGVVNTDFAVNGYPNMYILDGSIIQGNLGVNPSLSITAISEYAMSKITRKNNLPKT